MKLNVKPMTGRAVLRTGVAPDPRDRIQFGDFEIIATALDGNCRLAVRDRQSPLLKTFRGALWFPLNARYRVEAAFTPYPQPKELLIPDTSGRIRTRQLPGYVTFRLNGETRRLEPVATGNELFFMFKDRTSGRETYGAGRYLDSEMPKNGKVVLDFQQGVQPVLRVQSLFLMSNSTQAEHSDHSSRSGREGSRRALEEHELELGNLSAPSTEKGTPAFSSIPSVLWCTLGAPSQSESP